MNKTMKTLPALLAALLLGGPVLAEEQGDHSMHDHSATPAAQSEVKAGGVLHTIDAENKKVNITHDAIPEINWPKMTMDIPVTNRVDLSKFKGGDKVSFTLKQGMDQQYRITSMEPAQATEKKEEKSQGSEGHGGH